MRRSIRWTLWGWYAGILALVIGTLGVFLDLRYERAVFDEVDAVLLSHAHGIANAIELDEEDGYEVEIRGRYRDLRLPGIDDDSWFAAWSPDRRLLVGKPVQGSGYRKQTLRMADGVRVVTARRMDSVRGQLRAFRRTIVLGGLGAYALALLGGWVLVTRLLRPIDRISETAARISGSNTGARIDIGETESELGRLAETLNEAFDRLEAAVERQVRFTADASHELRTPLSVMAASTEWALRRERDPGEYEEAFEAVGRAATRMRVLVENLLVLARSDAGELFLDATEVDLADVAEDVSTLLGPIARQRGVRLEVGGRPALVEADRERIFGAVTALAHNALLHADARVMLRSGVSDGSAWLEVVDDGPGIGAEHRDHVFERFYRADPSREGAVGGSGLGLAIAKEIVARHAGTLRVEDARGGGAILRLELPMSMPHRP